MNYFALWSCSHNLLARAHDFNRKNFLLNTRSRELLAQLREQQCSHTRPYRHRERVTGNSVLTTSNTTSISSVSIGDSLVRETSLIPWWCQGADLLSRRETRRRIHQAPNVTVQIRIAPAFTHNSPLTRASGSVESAALVRAPYVCGFRLRLLPNALSEIRPWPLNDSYAVAKRSLPEKASISVEGAFPPLFNFRFRALTPSPLVRWGWRCSDRLFYQPLRLMVWS